MLLKFCISKMAHFMKKEDRYKSPFFPSSLFFLALQTEWAKDASGAVTIDKKTYPKLARKVN